MLNENIKTIRKSKGLSQEELAVKLNVVRQTVSKWEQGLSVPDSDMLTSLSDALETPVSTMLGENVVKQEADELKAICEKLEVINLQLARRKNREKSGASLPVHCTLCSDGACLGGADSLKQPVSRLEFQRPGDCRFRCGLSCVRVAVCPIRADSFCRFTRRGFYDVKEVVTSESAASVCIDLFAGLCYNIYGI